MAESREKAMCTISISRDGKQAVVTISPQLSSPEDFGRARDEIVSLARSEVPTLFRVRGVDEDGLALLVTGLWLDHRPTLYVEADDLVADLLYTVHGRGKIRRARLTAPGEESS